MGTIKVGFFNLKFIITPTEFNQIIEDENCFFIERCPSPILVEKRNLKEILKDYEIFYNRVMTNEKFENSKDRNLIKDWFILDRNVDTEWTTEILSNGSEFTHKRLIDSKPENGPRIRLNNFQMGYEGNDNVCLGNILSNPEGYIGFNLWYQKGVEIDRPDGIYYDIVDSKTYKIYELYENLTSKIKNITSPLSFTITKEGRFSTVGKTLRTAIRISENAKNDIKNHWLFKHYELEIPEKKLAKK